MPKLVIIDGYSVLYRAFFAPGPYLSTADGTPTGAVLVFTNNLLMVIEEEKPDAIYVAWDAPGPTFRHETYKEYKAGRPEAGDDLKKQFPIARQIVSTMGIPAIEVPRFEADDLIGTLATIGVKSGYKVVILSGDTDELQLVGDGVKVRMLRRGVSETKMYDVPDVVERYGLEPKRLPEWKALVGDTSDNIPGVPGIGDKTATKLLQQYESLEDLLAHKEELPPNKIRENLIAAGDQPLRSRDLATIHCEAPFEGPIQTYNPTPEIWTAVHQLFTELEFRSIIRRIPGGAEVPTEKPADIATEAFSPEIVMLSTAADLQPPDSLTIRIRADSQYATRAEPLAVALASTPEKVTMLVGDRAEQPDADLGIGGIFGVSGTTVPLDELAKKLAGVKLAGHNVKYEQVLLSREGLAPDVPAFDSLIAAYLLAPGRASYPLEDLAKEYLRVDVTSEDQDRRTALEAAAISALQKPMREKLRQMEVEKVFDEIELPLIPVLAEMERVGVPIDRPWLEKLSAELAQLIDQSIAEIYSIAGEEFNIGSTQQLQRILFDKLKLPSGRKIKTGFSTSAEVLEQLAAEHEICRKILEYRELTKLKSTYADSLPGAINPETGRIHTLLNQAVAATGRLSSSDPNLQNIPVKSEVGREIRKAFIAPPGQMLLSIDYSQIELRIFAHYTQDTEMVRAFQADEDIHAATAMRLFNVDADNVLSEMRRRAKTVNFAVIYGQGEFGLANQLQIPGSEARAFIKSYFEMFPGVTRYKQETLEKARRLGYVETLLGRKRFIPEIRSGNFNIRQGAERQAVNMPVQGTAADIMKLAMIQVHNHLQAMCCNCVMLLQVHDELVFGIDESLIKQVVPEIVRIMENAFPLDVRLRVDARFGKNWAEMTPI